MSRWAWPGVAVAGLAGALLTVALLGRAQPDRLVSAWPADRATLSAPPAAVVLTFAAPVDPAQVHLGVLGPDGRSVEASRPAVSGAVVTAPVVIGPAGRYVVAYHAVSRRGGQLSGSVEFVVAAGGAGAGPPTAKAGPPTAKAGPPTAKAGPPPAGGGHQHGGQPTPVTAAVLGADAAAAVVLGVALTRRRFPGGPPSVARAILPRHRRRPGRRARAGGYSAGSPMGRPRP